MLIKNKKKAISILLGAVVVLGGTAVMVSAASGPLAIETQGLEPVTAQITFTEQGRCVYQNNQEVVPMLSGEVLEILVEEGQKVKKGDALAVLSASDVEFQIQRLENDIKGYNAQIYNLSLAEQKEKESMQGTKNQLIGQLTTLDSQVKGREGAEETRLAQIQLQREIVSQDRDTLRIAKRDLKDYRDESDYDSDENTYDPEYNQYKTAVNMAEKSLAESEKRLLELQNSTVEEGYYEGQKQSINAQIGAIDTRMNKNYSSGMQSYYYSMIESAKVSIQELTEKQGKSTLTAPCDGVVSALPIKDMTTVTQNTHVATIGCTPMVEVFVPVREIDGIQVGDRVQLTVNKRIGDTVATGKVISKDTQAEIKLSPLGVEESKVRVLISTQDPAVGIGYQMDVDFTVYREENCIVVPKKAVFEQEGQDSVWVVQDGAAQLQPVVKGVETREGYIINEGLEQGQVVIADANEPKLAPGKKVAV